MPLEGIENKTDNLKLLEDHLKSVAIAQSVTGRISYVASYKNLLAICYVGGTINFIDFQSKTESPVSNVLAAVRIIRRSFSLTSSDLKTSNKLRSFLLLWEAMAILGYGISIKSIWFLR